MKSRVAFYVVLAVLAVLATIMLLPMFIPVTTAIILGYLLFPVYDGMGRWMRSEGGRAALLVLLVLFVLALPLLLVVFQLADEVPGALRSADLTAAVEKVNGWMDTVAGRHIPLAENLSQYMGRVREAALRAMPSILGAVGSTALGLFILLYTLYYVLVDGRRIWADFILILPLEDEVKPILTRNLQQTVSGVLYVQLLIAAVQGAVAGIGYLIFGVPHVLFWTLVTMIVGMIPMIGTPVVWVPLAIARLAAGDRVGGIGLLIYGGVLVMNLDNVLKPRLLAGRASLHPLVALLGVMGGLQVFGAIGFIIGPVLLSLVVAMLHFHRDVALRTEEGLRLKT